ncbi:MAG: hypothetical protein JXD21_01355 [Candidatus Omnitrophica bacterium]|nr:hypothetical protein [Candidatus Omnitrophota bacterium]
MLFVMVAAWFINGDTVSGSERIFNKEINLIGGYSRQQQWTGKSSTLANSFGFEDFRKFSGEYGDFLTTDLQVRFSYDSLEDSRDAWAVELHNAWMQYRLGYGMNLRIGHFDPAFGLEPVIDTHGTVLQTLAPLNIGFKKDWGMALEGFLRKYDYKLALGVGSGMSLRRHDRSFLMSARVGTPPTENVQYGFSILYGDVIDVKGMQTFPHNRLLSESAVSKRRIGVDGQLLMGASLVKGEIAYGQDDSDEVLGYLLEYDYTLPRNQNLSFQIQFQSFAHDLAEQNQDDSLISLGLAYRVNENITLRAALVHDFNRVDEPADTSVLVQYYYYGG